MRIMETRPVRKITIMNELKMENHSAGSLTTSTRTDIGCDYMT
jgi:hypothetical protein